jgi:predicted DNA-binding transcriptional regulator AlpA
MHTTENDPLLNQREARQLLPMSNAWFIKMRWLGQGPPYITVGTRIFYRKSELLGWVEAQNRSRVRPVSCLPEANEAIDQVAIV